MAALLSDALQGKHGRKEFFFLGMHASISGARGLRTISCTPFIVLQARISSFLHTDGCAVCRKQGAGGWVDHR